VSPVRFLRTHYRVDPYRAPPVPLVDVVETSTTPVWARARSTSLYWVVAAPSDPTTWTCSLPDGPVRATDCSATIPLHDPVRYAVTMSSNRIVVRDRLPRMSLNAEQMALHPGFATLLSGTVRNSSGQPFSFAPIRIERWNGTTWTKVAVVYTSAKGSWSARYRPPAGRPPCAFHAAPDPLGARPDRSAVAPQP
jgi:hypothetical protein